MDLLRNALATRHAEQNAALVAKVVFPDTEIIYLCKKQLLLSSCAVCLFVCLFFVFSQWPYMMMMAFFSPKRSQDTYGKY